MAFTSYIGNPHSQPGGIELGLSPVISFGLVITGSASVSPTLFGFNLAVSGTAAVTDAISVSRRFAQSVIGVANALIGLKGNVPVTATLSGAGAMVFYEFAGFGVQFAQALDTNDVEVVFDSFLDFTYAPVLSILNYSIPGVNINAVYPYTSTSVRIVTNNQTLTTYTVTVTNARGIFGQMMDPNPIYHSASFAGISPPPTIGARAVSPTKVRVLFSIPVLNDGNLNNVANYTVQDLAGNSLTIASVSPEQATNTQSVALVLSTPLKTTELYQVTISSSIHSIVGNRSFSPLTALLYWSQETGPVIVPFTMFSGEVEGGILGDPDGQVFFSPSLNIPAPNSVIQVDEVDVCTLAYDSYVFPQALDPFTLFTFQKGVPPGPSVLGPTSGAVLWAPFPRNFEAMLTLSSGDSVPFAQDTVPVPTDAATLVLQETGDPQQFLVLSDFITGSSSVTAVAS